MYTKERFKNLVEEMIDTYGIRSYLNNIEEDMSEEETDEDLWFECPECGEPILYDDWAEDMSSLIDGNTFTCPVCEVVLDF